ncbi:hypothetical protein JCM8097_008280 [Rhodosporidiobolus ruineniae]
MPRHAVLTVGSTAFTPLVHAFLSPPSLAALSSLGIATALAQVGTSVLPDDWEVGTQEAQGVRVEVVRFKSDIEDEVGRADLVVSHAGAGSILSFLRPLPASSSSSAMSSVPSTTAPRSNTTKQPRQLLLVPNSTLMDSHQSDLADEMRKKGWAVVCERPEDLPAALAGLAGETSEKDELEEPKYPPLDENRVQRILDETLGYV